jgi:hypothetical protein
MEGLPRHSHHWRGIKGCGEPGTCNKASGRDGMCLEFFKVYWDGIHFDMLALYIHMYLEGGIMVCIPKTDTPTTPLDYWPIILLNTGYKILARILASSLSPTISDLLNPNEYCSVPGNTILDAAATLWDAVTSAELTHAQLCVLYLNFPAAYDRISHVYLVRMLKLTTIAWNLPKA